MTSLLSKAVAEIEKLPTDVQDSLASILLEQIVSDEQWTELHNEATFGTKIIA